MKRFIAGFAFAFVVCAAVFALQMHIGADKIAPTQIVLDNPNLTIERNALEEGQSSPVLTHTLPQLTVVIRGATIHIVNGNGTAVDKDRPARLRGLRLAVDYAQSPLGDQYGQSDL